MKRGSQLEVSWEKFDHVSITWDTIDVTVTPKAWVEWPLEWRPRALPELASVVGATFQDLAISSCLLTTQNVDHDVSAVGSRPDCGSGPGPVGSTSSMRSMRMASRRSRRPATTSTIGGRAEPAHVPSRASRNCVTAPR